ncbi:hypothetical protein F5Y15DRAFT_422643 [Xylariaceae sp. FL0016]|nr:hypothetical protein F5Y15DRAFT_422643 [Xylariaceae sp. FL0016]
MIAKILIGALAVASVATAHVAARNASFDGSNDVHGLGEVFGYNGPELYGDVAIAAPINCRGQDTYIAGYHVFHGKFDPSYCMNVCNTYNADQSHSSRLCRFFNTYMLQKDGVDWAQYCSIYTQKWESSKATNWGQYDGSHNYTVRSSLGYWDPLDQGNCQGYDEPTHSTTRFPTKTKTITSKTTKTTRTTSKPPTITTISTTVITTTPTNPTTTTTESTTKTVIGDLPTVTCDSSNYLVQSGSLYSVDLTTWNTTLLGSQVDISVSAVGYNIVDNLLYGVTLGTDNVTSLVKIGGDGSWANVSAIPGLSFRRLYNMGVVDESGTYWANYNGETWLAVDVVPSSDTYGQVTAGGRADLEHNCFDWAFVPGAGDYLWCLGRSMTQPDDQTQTHLMQYSRQAGVWRTLTNYGHVAGSDHWGAVSPGDDFTLIASEDNSGEIWKFPLPRVGIHPEYLGTGPASEMNDGARCINGF